MGDETKQTILAGYLGGFYVVAFIIAIIAMLVGFINNKSVNGIIAPTPVKRDVVDVVLLDKKNGFYLNKEYDSANKKMYYIFYSRSFANNASYSRSKLMVQTKHKPKIDYEVGIVNDPSKVITMSFKVDNLKEYKLKNKISTELVEEGIVPMTNNGQTMKTILVKDSYVKKDFKVTLYGLNGFRFLPDVICDSVNLNLTVER